MRKLLLSFFMCMLAIIGMQAEEVTFTVGTEITATTATLLNGKITLTTAKNEGTTAPAYNANNEELRLYYCKTGTSGNGGSATLTTDGTIKITSVKIAAASGYTPTVNYSVDGGDLATGTWNDTTMTISGIEAKTSFMFQNANTSNLQLRIKSITITYESTLDDSTPFLKADVTELAFRTKPCETTKTQIITLTTANLNNLAYEVDNVSAFEVVDNSDDTYSVTFTAPVKEGVTNATIVFSADEVEPVTINLTGVSSFSLLDVLNSAFTGVEGENTYGNWADKVAASETRYLGNSAINYGAIQLRSTNSNSGIVSDQSVGTVKKVTVKWNTNTTSGRTLDVYGSNTAYNSASNLYDDSTQGTKLGSIVCGTSTELVIEGDYEYIGLRSKSGAMYLDEIQIEWYVPIPENITSNNCYVVKVGDVWEEPAGCWYAAKFINKNTNEYTWSAVSESDAENNGYLFYLAPGNTPLGHEPQLDPDYKYTHVEFVQLPATVEAPADIRNLDLTDVEYKTSGEIWYDGKPSKVYSLADEKWLDEATGVNRVELAGGIGYAYGVVSAEGAIEVYNVNGAVVARGNDNVDLRGLGRGVYIIRNGNQVRKVVR